MPAWGSVRFMVPVHAQVTIFGSQVAFCSSVPWAWIAE